jgi:hypothetical protein
MLSSSPGSPSNHVGGGGLRSVCVLPVAMTTKILCASYCLDAVLPSLKENELYYQIAHWKKSIAYNTHKNEHSFRRKAEEYVKKNKFHYLSRMSHNTKGGVLRSQRIMTITLTRPTKNVLILGHLVAKSGTTCQKLKRGLTPLHEGTVMPYTTIVDVAVQVLGSWPELTTRNRIPRQHVVFLLVCLFVFKQSDLTLYSY